MVDVREVRCRYSETTRKRHHVWRKDDLKIQTSTIPCSAKNQFGRDNVRSKHKPLYDMLTASLVLYASHAGEASRSAYITSSSCNLYYTNPSLLSSSKQRTKAICAKLDFLQSPKSTRSFRMCVGLFVSATVSEMPIGSDLWLYGVRKCSTW
jgi:hypothetical protein